MNAGRTFLPVLILLTLAAATVAAAEGSGRRREIYGGALGGLLVGAVSYIFGLLIARRHRADPGRWDIWGLWGAGMLVRLALIGALWWAFDAVLGRSADLAMLSLAAVYLVFLFWEAGWLYRILVTDSSGHGVHHG